MKKTTTICLGNVDPIQYAKHPQPPGGTTLEFLEMWATQVCGLDISGIHAVGDSFTDSDGNAMYEVTVQHRAEFLRDRIGLPFRVPYIPGKKERTTFDFPLLPDGKRQDSLSECMQIIRKNWSVVGGQPPAWIAGEDPFLVQVIAEDMGITDIRDWRAEGERGEFPHKLIGG
ncbi:MAG: hypothetical protein AABY68_06190 [Pseudomonadota bacterium]